MSKKTKNDRSPLEQENFEGNTASKLGHTESVLQNLLASSANLSSNSSSDEIYATSSDEMEMGTAALEEATQAPANPLRDPSTAFDQVGETDDDDDLNFEAGAERMLP